MSEWIARIYRVGKVYRVVEGVLQFDSTNLEGIEERTAKVILERVRTSYPSRGRPWADPSAERLMEFEVEVRAVESNPDAEQTDP